MQASVETPSCSVLVVGLANSGKTFLIKQLSAFGKGQEWVNNHHEFIPSAGVNLDVLLIDKLKFVVREVSGHLLPTWGHYIADCYALMVCYKLFRQDSQFLSL